MIMGSVLHCLKIILIWGNIMAMAPARLVTVGVPLIVGSELGGAVAPNIYESMRDYPVIVIDAVSAANTGIITVTFDRGNGFNNPKVVNAGTSESFYEPGVFAVQLDCTVQNTTVVVGFSARDLRR